MSVKHEEAAVRALCSQRSKQGVLYDPAGMHNDIGRGLMSSIKEHSIMATLKQLSDTLEAVANKGMRAYGITLSQTRLLIELDCSEGGSLTYSQLRDILGVKQPTVWGIVSRLQEKGLVSLGQSESDPRAKAVRIEPAGREICRRSRADMDTHERLLTECLSVEEANQLESLLRRVLDHLEAART